MKLIVLALITIAMCICSKFLTKKFNFYDMPIGRKSHKKPTSYMGGIIFSTLILIFMSNTNFENSKINLILIGAVMISWVGFMDDKFNFNVGGKIALQIIPIFYLTSNDLLIISLGNYFGHSLYLGDTSVIFSMLIYYIYINAFNYADGIDGNILSQFISILFLLMIFMSISSEIKYLIIFMIISSSIFLFFNLSNSSFKLFMGDSGSMFAGFFIIGLFNILQVDFKIHPITLLWFTSYLLFEFVSTSLHRLINNSSIFNSGHDHMHYKLQTKTNNVFLTLIILVSLNLIFGTLGIYFENFFGHGVSLILFIFFFIIYFLIRIKLFKTTKFNQNL